MLQGAGGATTKIHRGCCERRRQAAVLPARETMVLMEGESAISPCRTCCSGNGTASDGGGAGLRLWRPAFSPFLLLVGACGGGVHPRGGLEKRFQRMYIERAQRQG
jgi:hypothetical protein